MFLCNSTPNWKGYCTTATDGWSQEMSVSQQVTEVMISAWRGDHQLLSDLLESGHDAKIILQDSGMQALHFAARNGHTICVLLLIEHGGANVDCQSKAGWTPLMLAAWMDHLPTCLALISRGADPFLLSSCGRNAINLYSTYLLLYPPLPGAVKQKRRAMLIEARGIYLSLN